MELLSQEELDEVQRFFEGTGKRMIEQMQTSIIAAWIVAQTPAEREEQWHRLQAVTYLESLLRDSPARNQMNQRLVERRASLRA